MKITIRPAVSEDALFLTSISFGSKRYGDYPEEYLQAWYESLTITTDYIKNNMVVVAAEEEVIVGYAAVSCIEEDFYRGPVKVSSGYWLDHLFVRTAHAHKGIERKLAEYIIAICKEVKITKLKILSDLNDKVLFAQLGAQYKELLLMNSEGQEICTFELMLQEEQASLEVAENQNTLEDKVMKDKETIEELEVSTDEPIGEYILDPDKSIFLEALKTTAPIGYKFECEEDQEPSGHIDYLEALKQLQPNHDEKAISEAAVTLEEQIIEEIKEPIVKEKNRKTVKETTTEEIIEKAKEPNTEEEEITLPTEEDTEAIEKCKEEESREEIQEIEEEEYVDEIEESIDEMSKEEIGERAKDIVQENIGEAKEEENVEEVYIQTEKEKMIKGDLYIAWGDEITQDRRHARRLLRELNLVDPEDRYRVTSLLKELFGQTGEYVYIEPEFRCNYGYNIHVGDNFYAGYNCVILDNAKVTIGDNCILSPQVGIYTLAYPASATKRMAGYEYARPVTIGDNVWIGGGAIVTPGITIGDNVVVAPGSVILSNVPDNVAVAGNPARIIKKLE